jgi:hypothetical protein
MRELGIDEAKNVCGGISGDSELGKVLDKLGRWTIITDLGEWLSQGVANSRTFPGWPEHTDPTSRYARNGADRQSDLHRGLHPTAPSSHLSRFGELRVPKLP